MARVIASIVLMFSLEAAALLLLVAAGGGAVVAIRLPTDNVRDVVMAMGIATNGVAGEELPWACCDRSMCMNRPRVVCWCLDIVDHCSAACKQCEKTNDSRHFCADSYNGFPGPRCHSRRDASRNHYGGIAAERRQEAAAMVRG